MQIVSALVYAKLCNRGAVIHKIESFHHGSPRINFPTEHAVGLRIRFDLGQPSRVILIDLKEGLLQLFSKVSNAIHQVVKYF